MFGFEFKEFMFVMLTYTISLFRCNTKYGTNSKLM